MREDQRTVLPPDSAAVDRRFSPFSDFARTAVSVSFYHPTVITYSDFYSAHSSKASSAATLEREIAIAIARDAAAHTQSTSPSHSVTHGSICVTPISSSTPRPTPSWDQHAQPSYFHSPKKHLTCDQSLQDSAYTLEQIPRLDPTRPRLVNPIIIRQSKSSPGLSHILSHKFSDTFFHPTVVHRPNLRSKVSVHSMLSEAEPSREPQRQELSPLITKPKAAQEYQQRSSPGDATDPSSYNTSGNMSSPRDDKVANSTEKTSQTSEISAKRSSEYKRAIQPLLAKAKSISVLQELAQEKPLSLSPISEGPPVVTPSKSGAGLGFLALENMPLTNMAQQSSRSRRRRRQRSFSKPTSTAF